MTRRGFVGFGAAFAAGLPVMAEQMATAADAAAQSNRLNGFAPLKVKSIRIVVGASAPFKAFHLSNTHIVRADATEKDPRKVVLAVFIARELPTAFRGWSSRRSQRRR